MTNWKSLISPLRLGLEGRVNRDGSENRTIFQRDYDRIIFSSPFRRMQNKTQVFPLPGSVFVHNRLTHSLEVASVGRSLGNMVANILIANGDYQNSLVPELGTIVSTACLAHDMGNPPFGHSGEEAISDFFDKGDGKSALNGLSQAQKTDFTKFDGNANAFRLLTHAFKGRREGGFSLTYTTLGAIVKYPYESILAIDKPKFGFFQSEKATYEKIASSMDLLKLSSSPLRFSRHPLVYLVEAADDICYQIMDLEDAHKLKILSLNETKALLMAFFNQKDDFETLKSIGETLSFVSDPNEQISYLRAMVIGKLIRECVAIFMKSWSKITEGEEPPSLFKSLDGDSAMAMKVIKDVSVQRIYRERSVVEIEIAGYKILGTLLEVFTDAMMNPSDRLSLKLISLMPEQYNYESDNLYTKLQTVVDFVSGMTDLYALDLYRKITGINLPGT